MNKSRLISALCAGVLSFLTMTSSVLAVTADNVKCSNCVGASDIAKKAVTSSKIKTNAVTKSKIKNGAVTESKLSGGVLDLIQSSSSSKRYVIVDSGDQIIGGVVGGELGRPIILTSQGYIASVEVTDGKVRDDTQVLFDGIDCTGTAYIDMLNSLEGTLTNGDNYLDQDRAVIGAVFNVQNNGMPGTEYWYLPKTPTLSDNMPVQSVRLYDWNTGTIECDAVSATITTALEIFQNDPAITGFPNAAFSAPLRYDYR